MTSFIKQIRGGLFGAAMLSLVVAVPAAAETQADQAPTVKVFYGTLDLSTPEGQAKLRAKVRRAAMDVCEYDGVLRDLNHMAEHRACLRKALASADVQLASVLQKAGTSAKLALDDRPVRR